MTVSWSAAVGDDHRVSPRSVRLGARRGRTGSEMPQVDRPQTESRPGQVRGPRQLCPTTVMPRSDITRLPVVHQPFAQSLIFGRCSALPIKLFSIKSQPLTLRHIGRLHRRPLHNCPWKKLGNHRRKQRSNWSRTQRRATAAIAYPALRCRSQASCSCLSSRGSPANPCVRIDRRPGCKSLRERELPGTASRVPSR